MNDFILKSYQIESTYSLNPKQQRIGLVGTGNLGANIGRRLKETGYNIHMVYDYDPDRAYVISSEFECDFTRSLKEISEKCDIVFTLAKNGEQLKDVYYNKGDNLLMAAKKTIFASTSQ